MTQLEGHGGAEYIAGLSQSSLLRLRGKVHALEEGLEAAVERKGSKSGSHPRNLQPLVVVVSMKRASVTPHGAADQRETSGRWSFAGGPVPLGN